MTYGVPHVPIATLPGMAERTLTISSAGKTFSVTGWKVGWLHGPTELVAAARAVKQFLTFVGSGPFQPAVARALALPDEYYRDLSADLERRRDLLMSRAGGRGLRGEPPRRHVLRDRRRRAPGLRRRDGAVLGPARAGRRGGGARPGLPRRPGGGAVPGPLRVLQAGRRPERGRRAAGRPRRAPAPAESGEDDGAGALDDHAVLARARSPPGRAPAARRSGRPGACPRPSRGGRPGRPPAR